MLHMCGSTTLSLDTMAVTFCFCLLLLTRVIIEKHSLQREMQHAHMASASVHNADNKYA